MLEMKSMPDFRKQLRHGTAALGIIATMPGAASSQVLAHAGFDWLMIDLEHAPIDATAMHNMIASTAGTNCAPFVRVPTYDSPLTKQALDSGALGIVFPMICSAEQAEQAVSSTRYPPLGRRGWGPFYAPAHWGTTPSQYLQQANDRITTVLLIEHPDAIENLDDILDVPGIDVALLAPNDLSLNMGYPGQPDHPEVIRTIVAACDKVSATSVLLGGVATSAEDAAGKIASGYQMLVLGYDTKLLTDSSHTLLTDIASLT